MRKLPDFEYDEAKSFRGWLRTVTLNKWRELQRRQARNATTAFDESTEPTIGAEADWFAEPK